MSIPRISVVIPTQNRRECLLMALDALLSQSLPLSEFEVIVVADGCTDGTKEALRAQGLPLDLRIIEQSNAGAASARNRGAAAARGGLLLFLDDDVLLPPSALASHLHVHRSDERRVGVGPYLLDPPEPGNYLGEQLFEFWRRTFAAMGEPGHVMGPGDCLSGNLSVSADTFASIGGFDSAFPACGIEDYELGMRLVKAGVAFVYVPGALGRHLETTDVTRSLQRNRRGGSSSILLVERHPEILPVTRLGRAERVSKWLVFGAPAVGRIAASLATVLLEFAQRLRARRAWLALYERLRGYWYWQGVADVAGDRAGWQQCLAQLRRANRNAYTAG